METVEQDMYSFVFIVFLLISFAGVNVGSTESSSSKICSRLLSILFEIFENKPLSHVFPSVCSRPPDSAHR